MAARLPCRIFIALSILLLSCLTTVMADEIRWRQYIEAGLKASQRGDYDVAARPGITASVTAEGFESEFRSAELQGWTGGLIGVAGVIITVPGELTRKDHRGTGTAVNKTGTPLFVIPDCAHSNNMQW